MSSNTTIYKLLEKYKNFDASVYFPKEPFPAIDIDFDDDDDDELVKITWVFRGADNGNYGNPTNYTHDEETRSLISKNNARHWLGKEVPWKGCKRPDNIERMHLLWESTRGKPAWNSGKKTGPLSEEHKVKIGSANKGRPKPKVTCPHCNKTGGASAMKRWHFDNCKGE